MDEKGKYVKKEYVVLLESYIMLREYMIGYARRQVSKKQNKEKGHFWKGSENRNGSWLGPELEPPNL